MKKRTTRLISIIMVVMMVMGMTAVGAYANDGAGGDDSSKKYVVTLKTSETSAYNTIVKEGDNLPLEPLLDKVTIPYNARFDLWDIYYGENDGRNTTAALRYTIENINSDIVVSPTFRINLFEASVDAPVYGKTPATTATPVHAKDYNASVVRWQKPNGEVMESTETFGEGQYTAVIGFSYKSGGILPDISNGTAKINGEAATRIEGRNQLLFAYSFNVTKPADDPTVDPEQDPSDNPTVDPENDPADNPTGGNTDADNSNTTTDADKDKAAAEADKNAQTGDDFNVNMWMAVMAVCLLGMAAAYTFRRNEASDR